MEIKNIKIGIENDSFSPHISCELKVTYEELKMLAKMPTSKANAKIGRELLSTLKTWDRVQRDLRKWMLETYQ